MSERTIAEIIGLAHPAYAVTVDDMLAWLTEQDVDVWPGNAYDEAPPLNDFPAGILVATPHERIHIPGPFDTLHAALEAAVRVVDDSHTNTRRAP